MFAEESTMSRSLRALTLVLVLALSGLALPGLTSEVQAQVAQTAVPFLQIAPDSRAAGMGNSGVALADNANATFWNPAGLAFQRNTEIGLTHANWLPQFNADLFYEYLVGTYHVPGIGTFGGHVTFLNLGESELRDGPGENGFRGEFRSYDFAGGVSYGVKLSERFAFGTGMRVIYSNLSPSTEEVSSGTGFSASFDLAALYRTRPIALGGVDGTLSLGANLANMGPTITYTEADEPLPTNLRVGTAFTLDFDEYNTLTVTGDLNKTLVNVNSSLRIADGDTTTVINPDPFYKALFTSWGSQDGVINPDNEAESLSLLQQFTMGAGLEYWYNDLFALRTGYFYENPQNGDRQFLTFGAGLRYNIIGVDISYLYAEESSPLANTLRFSLLISFRR
jgi:hypothetical protein